MPVDSNYNTNRRRSTKTFTQEELHDIEQKRLRGELSCAECRRLKLKCDKNIPCGSCDRRGCTSICPLGVLAAGQGTRYVLADTEQLHVKIHEMSNRIRQLEDALSFLQSAVSDETHPLLTENMLRVKFGSEVLNGPRIANDISNLGGSSGAVTEKTIDALGTLTLGSSGDVHYFGRSAGSEALMLRAGEDADDNEDKTRTTAEGDESQPCVQVLPSLFPFSSKSRLDPHALQSLEKSFPLQGRASQLCKLYLDHAAYFFRPIKGDELLGELLPSVYGAIASRERSSTDDADVDGGHTQSLATLFFIFSLGALLDLSLTPYNAEAEKYYELGRAFLSLHPVYNSPSLESVRAVGLMATYHSFAGRKYTRDSAWSLMSIAAKVAQSIGLHRDSSKWNLDSKLVQRRRDLFWEVFSADLSHSLALGRPPAVHPSYVDCEFPQDDDGALVDHEVGLWRMKHIFARDIYSSVAEITLITKSPCYSAILDLDKKVKGMSCPSSFNPFVSMEDVGEDIFHSSSLAIRDFYASQNKTVTILYLHRSFFAQAVLDHPDNPLLSPFAPSFLAACRSASIIVRAAENLFRRCAPMAARVWFLMYHMLSAAVILGTVVTRSPMSSTSPMAMRDFNIALDIFNEAAEHNERAKIAQGILEKLRDKAKHAFETVRNDGGSPIDCDSGMFDEEGDDIVAIFGGQMSTVLDRRRRVKHKHHHHQQRHQRHHQRPCPSSALADSSSSDCLLRKEMAQPAVDVVQNLDSDLLGAGDVDLAMDAVGGGLPDVHPSLVEYLNQESVRRALEHRDATITDRVEQKLIMSSSSHLASANNNDDDNRRFDDVNLDGRNPTTTTTIAAIPDPQTEAYRMSSGSSVRRDRIPGESEMMISESPLHGELGEGATGTRMHPTDSRSGAFDEASSSVLRTKFNPELVEEEIGSSNRVFANVDWFSFMRDCGIMDIEDG